MPRQSRGLHLFLAPGTWRPVPTQPSERLIRNTLTMLRSLSVGFETLRANPLRTILSTLGIVIGVAALVSVLSVGDGMERLARKEIGRTTDLQRIAVATRQFRLVDGTPFPVEKPAKFGDPDAMSLKEALGNSIIVNMMVSGVAIVTASSD